MRLANLAGRLMVGHPDDGFVDLALTGTPSGVGAHREPPIFPRDGDEVVSRIVRIGKIIQRFGAE
jgi:2-keto-4-pentenoate hydratase/2-oxohepta-3-ene-1,7-dioic acid hydratase in catechol pathway